MLHRNWRLAGPDRGRLGFGLHQIEKAAGIFALRPPGKKLNAYELSSPGGQRVVEAVEAR